MWDLLLAFIKGLLVYLIQNDLNERIGLAKSISGYQIGAFDYINLFIMFELLE